MSLSNPHNAPNIFNNQTNSNSNKTPSNGLFSIGTNNQTKTSPNISGNNVGSYGLFGNPSSNQNTNPNTAINQNHQGGAGLFSQNTNETNIVNQKLNTPMKNNNQGTSNIFNNNQNDPHNKSNNVNTNASNQFNPTITSGLNTIFGVTPSNSSIFPNNADKSSNTNTNQNNEQKSGLFNQGQPNQNQTKTAANYTGINHIFNTNPSTTNNPLISNNHQTSNTSNPSNHTFTNSNTHNNQQTTGIFTINQNSLQPTQQNNHTGLLGTQNQTIQSNPISGNPGTNNQNTNLFSKNTENKPLGQQSNTLLGPNNQSTSLFNTSNLFNTTSDGQNKGDKNFLPLQTQGGPIGGNVAKTHNSLITGLFTSLSGGTTANKNLYGESSNTAQAQSEPRTQFITAPSNILGINLDTLSDSVKKAYKNENKSIKDFIRDVEKDFYKEDRREYYKKIPNDPYWSNFHAHNPSEAYHDKYRVVNHKNFKNVKEKLSDYDFYENYPIYYHKSSKCSKIDSNSFLQNKRKESPEREKNYNFNRNIIELSMKVRNNMGSSLNTYYKCNMDYDKRNNENKSENIPNDKITDTYLIDLDQDNEIPNGAVSQDKVIEIFIEFTHKNLRKMNIPLNINKNNLVSLLKELLLEKLKQREDSFFDSLSIDNLILIKQNTLMKDTKSISDYKLSDGDKLTLAVSKLEYEQDEDDDYHYNNNKNYRKGKIHNKNTNKNQVAPLDALPNLTKQGYKTNPDFKIICRMTLEELRNVENFTIGNSNGKIELMEKVDLTELDLDDIIDINQYYIQVYQGKTKKPPRGEGLNKPAIYTLYNIKPENDPIGDEDKKAFIELLTNTVREQGGEFIKYHFDSYELIFSCKEIQ